MSAHVRSVGGERRPRAAWHADVVALGAEGLNGIQIARRLGLSSSFVYDLIADPTGEGNRARKERNRGVCVDCGGKTYSRQTARCRPCERKHKAAAHGTRSKYQAGCSCDACRAANRAHMAALKRVGVAPNHGTASGYTNYGCRCDACTKAHRDAQWLHPEYQMRWRAKVRGTEPPRHGTSIAYSAYACRCDECRAGSAARKRRYRDRKRQEAA